MNPLMGTKMVNMNYYPTCPSPELAIGLGHNGDCAEIPPLDGALVINVGDTLQVSYHSKQWEVQKCKLRSIGFEQQTSDRESLREDWSLPEVVKRDGVVRYKELLFQDYMNNFFGQPHEGKKSLDFARAD
ncbi:2-oxoglutarate (2OG) and Fe(II)-dependent oxygenase superfamily protein [Raphanus sativus]|nr:2-oxoglutarate (2OG) and Fe(II)-dependent oxygenase superfamily protein [Raphanus sativus]